MPFAKVERSFRSSAVDANTIRIGSHLASDKISKGIYISVGADVVKQAGWPVKPMSETRQATTVAVLEGTGEDSGFLMLAYDEAQGYTLGSERTGARSFYTNVTASKLKHYVLNEVPCPVGPVDFSIDEKAHTVLIQCPDWLRYNPESYQEPEQEVVQPTRHPLHVVPVERDEGRPHRRRVR